MSLYTALGLKIAAWQICLCISANCKSIWSLYFPVEMRWFLAPFFVAGVQLFLSPYALILHFIHPDSFNVGGRPICCHWGIDQLH